MFCMVLCYAMHSCTALPLTGNFVDQPSPVATDQAALFMPLLLSLMLRPLKYALSMATLSDPDCREAP